jgi:hypothetical protein
MSRRTRRLLVVLALLIVLGSVAAGVRVADVGTPSPEPTVDTDAPPREVVLDAGRVLDVANHRLVTRVYVRDANASGGRALVGTYRHVRDYADRQHLAVYDTYRPPTGSRPVDGTTQFHTLPAFVHRGTVGTGRTVVYVTDGGSVSEFGVPAEGSEEPMRPAPGDAGRPRFVDPRYRAGIDRGEIDEIFGDVFVPHDAEWRVVERTEERITYGIDDASRYFETRPMPFDAELLEGSRIRVTVDRDTGRLRSIRERRLLRYRVERVGPDGHERTTERRVDHVIETTVDRYGTADVRRPDGTAPTPRQLLADLLHY